MSKTRFKKKPTEEKSRPMHISFKIGGRDSERSAHGMSTADLEKAYKSKSTRPRDINKIKTILENRGVSI